MDDRPKVPGPSDALSGPARSRPAGRGFAVPSRHVPAALLLAFIQRPLLPALASAGTNGQVVFSSCVAQHTHTSIPLPVDSVTPARGLSPEAERSGRPAVVPTTLRRYRKNSISVRRKLLVSSAYPVWTATTSYPR